LIDIRTCSLDGTENCPGCD